MTQNNCKYDIKVLLHSVRTMNTSHVARCIEYGVQFVMSNNIYQIESIVLPSKLLIFI